MAHIDALFPYVDAFSDFLVLTSVIGFLVYIGIKSLWR